MRRTAKHYFDQSTSSNAQSAFSIAPRLSNLTLGPVPTDLSEVVVSDPQHAGITDKIHNLLNEYRTEITVVPLSGGCVDDVTARCPRALIQSLNELLKQDGRACHRETNLMVNLLENLLSKNSLTVGLTRNFWLQMHRVFEELNTNESSLNLYASAVRAMAYPLSSDIQALPSTNMILAANDVFEQHQDGTDPLVDADFKAKYAHYIKPQPNFGDLVSRVVRDLPSSLGLDTSKPATNLVGITPSDASSHRQLFDLDMSSSIHAQGYSGLKNLFSSMTLTIPIKDLNIFYYDAGKPTISFYAWESITDASSPPKVRTVYTAWSQSIEDLDLNKSILDQDWAVKGSKATNYKTGTTVGTWVNVDTYNTGLVQPTLAQDAEDTSKDFTGVSGRQYTYTEVTSLASGLDALWRKITQIHLPSPQQLDAGLGILASGLGAIGSFTGCAGLVKASDIMSGVREGLGYFLPAFNNAMGVKPDPKASIVKNALTVIPALLEAGKATYESMGVSTLDQRVSLGNFRSVVEQNFGRVRDVSASSKRVALSLPV